MSVVLERWSPTSLAEHADAVLRVYAAAMDVSWSQAQTRRSILNSQAGRPGLRTLAARDGEELVGIAYGYRGEAGQWWHDRVWEALPLATAQRWLHNAFEVCELHVIPSHQGRGLGQALLAELLAGTGAATAVLTTPDRETRARAFYRAGQWCDLATGLRFAGDPREFAVLGRQLGREGATPP